MRSLPLDTPAWLPPDGPPRFPDPSGLGEEQLVAFGGSVDPPWLLASYRAGSFVCGRADGSWLWWSPPRRALFDPVGLRVPRRLGRVLRSGRLRFTIDRAFESVVRGCVEEHQEGRWIEEELIASFLRLHASGHAHSFEAWSAEALAGGLFGVRMGAFFSAESMFHRERDASKAVLVRAVEHLFADGVRLFDAQWPTPHLLSLGALAVPRDDYLVRLRRSLD